MCEEIQDAPVQDSGPEAEPSLAEQALIVDRDLGRAIQHVLELLNSSATPMSGAPALAMILIGARGLRELGWPQEQALGAVAEAFEGDLELRALVPPRPN